MNEIDLYYECTSLENFKSESDGSFTIEGNFLKVFFDEEGKPIVNKNHVLRYEFGNLFNGYVTIHSFPSLPGISTNPIQYVFRFGIENNYIFISFKDLFMGNSFMESLHEIFLKYSFQGKFTFTTTKVGYIENKFQFENNFN